MAGCREEWSDCRGGVGDGKDGEDASGTFFHSGIIHIF